MLTIRFIFFCDIWLHRSSAGWLKADHNLANPYEGFIQKFCPVYRYIFSHHTITVKTLEMKITTNICKLKRFIILSKKGIVFWGKTSAGLTIH